MATEPMLKLSAVAKVFHTDEVETHALSDIHLEIQRGEYLVLLHVIAGVRLKIDCRGDRRVQRRADRGDHASVRDEIFDPR